MKSRKRSWFEYLLDFWKGATKYPNGLIKPFKVIGFFPETSSGNLQKVFFRILLKNGFKRTCWQIVFPGQIVGITKKINADQTGANEFHVRFYDDGTIDCELEVSRFELWHWAGPRCHDFTALSEILAKDNQLSDFLRREIEDLFGIKQYSAFLTRKNKE